MDGFIEPSNVNILWDVLNSIDRQNINMTELTELFNNEMISFRQSLQINQSQSHSPMNLVEINKQFISNMHNKINKYNTLKPNYNVFNDKMKHLQTEYDKMIERPQVSQLDFTEPITDNTQHISIIDAYNNTIADRNYEQSNTIADRNYEQSNTIASTSNPVQKHVTFDSNQMTNVIYMMHLVYDKLTDINQFGVLNPIYDWAIGVNDFEKFKNRVNYTKTLCFCVKTYLVVKDLSDKDKQLVKTIMDDLEPPAQSID